MGNASTNLLDIAWIPVTGPGGDAVVTVHDALSRSGELSGIGSTDSPAEKDAIMRFLIPMAALVLRETGGDGEVDDESAIRAVLARHRDVFDLFDQDRPFLQEWHVDAEGRATVTKPSPLSSLHVHAPGPATAPWCLRSETRDPADLSILPLLLLVAWYDRANSNAKAPDFYPGKRISGMPPGTKVGKLVDRTSFYLVGETLADTLSLNVPIDWIESSDLPVWLDQDAEPSPTEITSGAVPVWRYTWAPNRALIITDADGSPSGWVSGMTRRPIPQVGGEDCREDARRIVGTDHHALMVPPADADSEPRRIRLGGDLSGTQGIEIWYREQVGDRITALERERHLEHRDATHIGIYVDHRDKQNNSKYATWVEAPLRLLTIPASDERDALMAVVQQCTGWTLQRHLAEALDVVAGENRAMLDVAQAAMFSTMDRAILPPLDALAHGRQIELGDVVRRTIGQAIRCFETITDPLSTPESIPRVSAARRGYSASLHKNLNGLKEETE